MDSEWSRPGQPGGVGGRGAGKENRSGSVRETGLTEPHSFLGASWGETHGQVFAILIPQDMYS